MSQPTIALPCPDHVCDVVPGAIKKIKTDNRRSDSTYLVDPFKVRQDPTYNVRVRTPDYEQHIADLAQNMIDQGYDPGQPISACAARVDGEDVLLVRAGNSRLEAARMAIEKGANFTTIPVVIRPKTDSPVDMIVDLVRSNSGRPLGPVELAAVVKRLSKMELTDAEIARRLDFTPTYVAQLAYLASAPPALTLMVVTGQVSASLASTTIREVGPVQAAEKLGAALAAATKDGKAKLTPSRMPGAQLNKGVKKAARRLYDTLISVRSDPGLNALSAENRERITALLDELTSLESSEAAAATEAENQEAGQEAIEVKCAA